MDYFKPTTGAEHLGGDKNARDKFKDHEHYQMKNIGLLKIKLIKLLLFIII